MSSVTVMKMKMTAALRGFMLCRSFAANCDVVILSAAKDL
jgi:hypothetical protein